LDEGGPFAKLVLVEYRLAIGMIQRWIRLHQEEYLRGETDLDIMIDTFLDQEQFKVYRWRPGSR
ncbi:MAG: hypothetical protein ACI85U_003532, partial [Candidatus Promineifilaceae bacterium]